MTKGFVIASHENRTIVSPEPLQVIEYTAEHITDFWVAVHATEYLIELGHSKQAGKICKDRLVAYKHTPEKRIGLWRIQYKLAKSPNKKQLFLKKIITAYLTSGGPDRIHAAETLAKLHICFKNFDQEIVQNDLKSDGTLRAYVLWGLSVVYNHSGPDKYQLLINQLTPTENEQKKLAAYGLTFLSKPDTASWLKLAINALGEKNEETGAYLLGAAYQLYDDEANKYPPIISRIRQRLLLLETSPSKAARIELCRALAVRTDPIATETLKRLFNQEHLIEAGPAGTFTRSEALDHPWNKDVQCAAAFALLKKQNTINQLIQ